MRKRDRDYQTHLFLQYKVFSMNKTKMLSSSSLSLSRSYLVVAIILAIMFFYILSSLRSSPSSHLADLSTLPKSKYFIYANLSGQIHFNEIQGVLYVPPPDQSSHFASIKPKAVRGNHRHVGSEMSISGEVITLLQGHFQIRIGDGDTNAYEDHRFDISKTGILALQFTAEKCHAVKNIGSETNWFASYYIRSKNVSTPPPVDREGCRKIRLS